MEEHIVDKNTKGSGFGEQKGSGFRVQGLENKRVQGANIFKQCLQVFGVFCLVLISLPVLAQTDDLPRKALTGMAVGDPEAGRAGGIVRRITAGSEAEKAGFQVGDVLVKINGQVVKDSVVLNTLWESLKGGQVARFTVLRNGQLLEKELVPPPAPKDEIEGCDLVYSSIIGPHGQRQRIIISKPKNAQGKLPAIFFVEWLSCDTVELPASLQNGWGKMMRGVASKSGFVMMRLEKPGIGDSEGPPCADCDYLTELAAHKAALQELKKLPYVDPDSIYLLGASMGGAMSPLVAQGEKVKGLIVTGTFTKTWLEHMLEIERRRLELSGKSRAEIAQGMVALTEFHSLVLNQKLTPEEACKLRPHLTQHWYDEPRHQYGRHIKYYQQVQDLNIEAAWEKITAPVLVVYGEFDWIMTREDHVIITRIVNKNHPGTAEFVEIPGMDHHYQRYASVQDAFDRRNGNNIAADETVSAMVNWLKKTQFAN